MAIKSSFLFRPALGVNVIDQNISSGKVTFQPNLGELWMLGTVSVEGTPSTTTIGLTDGTNFFQFYNLTQTAQSSHNLIGLLPLFFDNGLYLSLGPGKVRATMFRLM
ncbi:hypothetical protein HYR54_00515 [Candidatus Acetothermia bacterium]|nr:hypothetical protein [Candidatus Acetothermia bacterium]